LFWKATQKYQTISNKHWVTVSFSAYKTDFDEDAFELTQMGKTSVCIFSRPTNEMTEVESCASVPLLSVE